MRGLIRFSMVAGLGLMISLPVQADWRDWLDSAKEAVTGKENSSEEPSTSGLTSTEMASGLREALIQGADRAVNTLGQKDGFLQHPSLKIPIPPKLDPVAKGLRAVGQGKRVDAFETSLNRAAEAAVPAAREVVVDGIRNMTIEDARAILTGGDTAATDYLRRTGGDRIRDRIRPLVADATDQAQVTRYYKGFYEKAGTLGQMVDMEPYDIDNYVTDEATDALFTLIAEEERRIREDPVARGTELLKKVFGR